MQIRQVFGVFLCLSSLGLAGAWGDQAAASANQTVMAGGGSSASCIPGFNEEFEKFDYVPYEDPQRYSTKCNTGETWAECARRLFLGNR